MKAHLLVLTTILCYNLKSQKSNDYITYYNLCNEGDRCAYMKNYELAVKRYDSAFQFVDYIHVFNLLKVARYHIELGNKSTASYYAKQAIKQGLPPNIIHKKIKQNSAFKLFLDSFENKIYTQYPTKNIQYAKEIDSLVYIDQDVIRKNPGYRDGKNIAYKVDRSKLPKNLFELDSIIFKYCLELIQKYGFPSEKVIGYESAKDAWLLFHHNIRKPQNEKYLEIVKNATKNGEIDPSNFAWLYDQLQLNKGNKPYFYYAVEDISKLSNEERQTINMRRKEYGIKPLEAYEIIATEHSISQRSLW